MVIDEVCYRASHSQEIMAVGKTYTRINNQASLMETCKNTFHLKELSDIFFKTKRGDSPELSIKEKTFVEIMEHSFERDSNGCWCAHLRLNKTDTVCQATEHMHSMGQTFLQEDFRGTPFKKRLLWIS